MPCRPSLALACLAAPLVAQPTPVATPDQSILRASTLGLGVTFANPSFAPIPNAAAHQQDMVVDHAGWQYVAWWNQDRHVEVARRRRFAPDWESLVLADYTLLGDDAHDTVNLGICPGDGTLHLAFDHHVSPLHHRISVPGLATNPAGFAWQPSLFGPIGATLEASRGPLANVTYPRFVPTPAGDLQLVWREFTSGNGRIRMADYAAATGTWSNDRVVIERTGSHSDPLGGSSSARNPYFNGIAYDDQGVLHATWTWRERAPTAYNRDIAYAYSPDGGITWWNGAHARIADTSTGQAITHTSPGVNVVPLGAAFGLMNDQAQAVDRRGRVHVVMYHKDVADTRVSYGSPSNSHYNHYWKDADGLWRTSRLPTIGNRPKLFCGHDGALFLAYVASGTLRIDRATPEADYLDWTTVRSHAGRFDTSAQGAVFAPSWGTLLTIGTQVRATVPGTPTALGVVDLGFAPTEQRFTAALLPIADSYARGGSYASTIHGASDRLIVKRDGGADYEREAFLKFDISALRGVSVRRVLLVGTLRAQGPETRTTPYFAHAVADDSWTEATLTWNSRPAMGPPFAAHFGRATMQWDVTNEALREAGGDGTLSLALRSDRAGADRILHLHSRESADRSGAPRLLVEF